jgi:DNA helicase-2/ATP-dependent DNA helicase PcrA
MSPALNPLFRPGQYEILNYRGGKVGVAAVPGSGKTFTLSHLAARLVERLTETGVVDEQEVLIVTFANSAVNSFKARIAEIVQTQRGLLPYVGYRVRTLHGLAHDIVRERPSLAGLAEDFKIVDERMSAAILRDVVDEQLRTSGHLFLSYVAENAEASQQTTNRIQQEELPDLAVQVADSFIRQAKDTLLDPVSLHMTLAQLLDSNMDLPLARFGADVYAAYQRSLAYRGAVDFDDLVRLALQALESDESYLKRLQKRWPFILEDEAQDSSQLQERMLRLLSGGQNWVRVGDPNQAINTTFTTANPKFLRVFLVEPGVKSYGLIEAGRSTQPIIDLANTLMRWSVGDHPALDLRSAFYAQDIEPAPPGDSNPNPSPDLAQIHIHYQPGMNISPEKEREIVAASIAKWLPDNPDKTVAVLVPENSTGFKLSELLKDHGLPYDELLRSTTATRDAAQLLRSALVYLASPMDYSALSRLYRDFWWPNHLGRVDEASQLRDEATNALAHLRTVEAFLWPGPGDSPLDALKLKSEAPELYDDLEAFRQLVTRWLTATILPIDQLTLTLSHDLFTQPHDIALGYKIAQLLRASSFEYPEWRLPDFAEQLRAISQNERKFLGFDDAEQGYEPEPGKVTIATMHAAKGLEWDRVYLMAVSNYGFPSVQPNDTYISEKWYLRDRLNLQAETLAQLRTLSEDAEYVEGEATRQARIDYAAERLRLLYVGITRAKRELIVTWNMGRFWQRGGQTVNQAALPLVALWEYVSGTLKV